MKPNLIESYTKALDKNLCEELINFYYECDDKNLTLQGSISTPANPNDINKDYKDSTDLSILNLTLNPNTDISNKSKVLTEKVYDILKNYVKIYSTEYKLKSIGNTENIGSTYHGYTPRKEDLILDGLLIKKYKTPNQGYHLWHSDYSMGHPRHPQCRRALVCMFYLNDVNKGGETEFYHQKIKIKPEQGKLVIFPAYFTHTHRGNKPISNDKYILNSWTLYN